MSQSALVPDMPTATGTGAPSHAVSGQVPPGGIITDADGYLVRNRPAEKWFDWSTVQVSRSAALQLSHGLSTRDLEIMRFAERFGMVTFEQITRVFFNSENPAAAAVMHLRKRRYLARLPVPPTFITDAVGIRPGSANYVYVLDWNGYFYLRYHAGGPQPQVVTEGRRRDDREADNGASGGIGIGSGEYADDGEQHEITRWNPATVAQVNSRFGHTLGVSEIWSYIMTAVRSTYERHSPQHPDDPIKYHLKAFLLNEKESFVPSNLAVLTSSRHVDIKEAGRLLVIPDATVALSFQVSLAPMPSMPSTNPAPTVPTAPARQPRIWTPPGPPGPPESSAGQADKKHKRSNQYDPTLASWKPAFLPIVPFPARGQISEPTSPLAPHYRFMFVEMETGTNNRFDLQTKIAAYNRVFRRQEIWQYMYGPHFPRVLVVVRNKDQIERTAIMWRREFAHQAETAVLLTSLQHLADVYTLGRRALIQLPCWLDVLAEQRPVWRTLDDALAIDLVVARAEAAIHRTS